MSTKLFSADQSVALAAYELEREREVEGRE